MKSVLKYKSWLLGVAFVMATLTLDGLVMRASFQETVTAGWVQSADEKSIYHNSISLYASVHAEKDASDHTVVVPELATWHQRTAMRAQTFQNSEYLSYKTALVAFQLLPVIFTSDVPENNS